MPTDAQYIEAAQAWNREGIVEVDADAKVSRGEDPGAYVQAWIWIDEDDCRKP